MVHRPGIEGVIWRSAKCLDKYLLFLILHKAPFSFQHLKVNQKYAKCSACFRKRFYSDRTAQSVLKHSLLLRMHCFDCSGNNFNSFQSNHASERLVRTEYLAAVKDQQVHSRISVRLVHLPISSVSFLHFIYSYTLKHIHKHLLYIIFH